MNGLSVRDAARLERVVGPCSLALRGRCGVLGALLSFVVLFLIILVYILMNSIMEHLSKVNWKTFPGKYFARIYMHSRPTLGH